MADDHDYPELSALGGQNLEEARRDLLPSVRAKFYTGNIMTIDQRPEQNNGEEGLQALSFSDVQRLRRDPATDQDTKQLLDYQIQAMVKQAENLGAMDFAKEYIKKVYAEEPDFRKAAERMVSESSQIEEQSKDPQMNPLSGYVHAEPLHGIVREAINTQAEALMVLHYAQMANHPQADQEEYRKLFSEAAASYGRARFWDADIKPGEGGRSISDLVNLPELSGHAGEALHDAFGITSIELSAAKGANTSGAEAESSSTQADDEEAEEGVWEEVEENPESESGKDVERRLSEFRERMYSARNQAQRKNILRERDGYLNGLHREGKLPENVDDMEKLWAMELIEGIDSTRPSSSLREKLDNMLDRAEREGMLTDELRQLLSFEVRGVIKVARLNDRERSGDRLNIERMANLPLNIRQDDIDAAWTRRAEAHAASSGFNTGDFEEAMFRAYYRVTREFQYGSQKEYFEWLDTEELNSAQTPIIDRSPHPEYWRYLDKPAQDLLNRRRELNNLAIAKRNLVGDLDTYGKLNEVKTIETREVRLLYEKMDGFREGLEEYVHIFSNPDKDENKITVEIHKDNGDIEQKKISIREVETEEDADKFRYLVREKVKNRVKNEKPEILNRLREGVVEQARLRGEMLSASDINIQVELLLEQEAKEAEQAAQNALFGTNGYESLVQLWTPEGRLDVKSFDTLYMGRFVNAALVEQIYPLTTAIDKADRGEDHGKHAPYIRAQVDRLKRENGGRLKYDAIQIVDTDSLEEATRTYWTIVQEPDPRNRDRNIRVLRVPEVYPRKLIESPWERNKIKMNGVERSLMDYLRVKAPIPWQMVRTSEFTGKYGRDAKKAHVISEAQLKVQPYRPEVETEKWEFTLKAALAKLQRDHHNVTRLRFIFNQQIYPDNPVPYMEGDYAFKLSQERTVAGRTMGYGFFSSKEELFFPWDNKNKKMLRKVK